MPSNRVEEAARYLLNCGQLVVGFNSAAYDLKLIAHHCKSNNSSKASQSSRLTILMFLLAFGPARATVVAQSFASGMECGAKLMDGKDAITAWENNELETVLEYCDGDCKLLASVRLHCYKGAFCASQRPEKCRQRSSTTFSSNRSWWRSSSSVRSMSPG